MPKLDTPTGLGLTDPEDGRESNSLRITFNLVPDATNYVLSLNGVSWPAVVAPGETIEPLLPNTVYSMSIVARASGFSDSDPSSPVLVLTRPPTPANLSRAPIDLNGWGLVLDWNEPGGWNDSAKAIVLLRRSDDGNPPTTIARGDLAHRYVDTRYPLAGEKTYDTLIQTPNAIGGSENQSRPGSSVSARGPFQTPVVGGAANQPLSASQERGERFARALLGLRH